MKIKKLYWGLVIIFIFTIHLNAQKNWNVDYINRFIRYGSAHDIWIDSTYAYIANGKAGVIILDISDPSDPIYINQYIPRSHYDLFSEVRAYSLCVKNNYAFVTCGQPGLYIIDISDPKSPVEVGHWGDGYYISTSEIFVEGNYAYVSSGDDLYIIDVSDPKNPQEVGFYKVSGRIDEIFVNGNFAYIAAGYGDVGLHIIDVSNPNNPVEVGYYNTYYNAWDVYVDGIYAYVCVAIYGLFIIDISKPDSPVKIVSYETKCSDVFVSNGYAYIADGYDYFRIIDVSNPFNPQEVGFYETGDKTGNNTGIYVKDEYAYLLNTNSGIRIIDIKNKYNPIEIGFYDTGDNLNFKNVYVYKGIAYVVDEYKGVLRIFDTSNVSKIKEISQCYDVGRYPGNIFVSDNYAYITDSEGVLHIIDVSYPSDPQKIGYFNTGNYSLLGIFVKDNYVFLTDGGGGFHVIDISDRFNPNEIGSFYSTHFGYDVFIDKNYAYVAGSGLQILDINDPYNPIEISYNDLGAEAVFIYENHAYVATYGGLRIFDISNPYFPKEIGSFGSEYYCRDIFVKNNYAYLSDNFGLHIIDIFNPYLPSEVGYFNIEKGKNNGIYVSNDYSFIAARDSGLYILKYSPKGILSFSNDKIDFGIVNPGDIKNQIVTFTNNGEEKVVITNIYITGQNANEFNIISDNIPLTIEPSQYFPINIQFSSRIEGYKQAWLVIRSTNQSNPDSILLTTICKQKPKFYLSIYGDYNIIDNNYNYKTLYFEQNKVVLLTVIGLKEGEKAINVNINAIFDGEPMNIYFKDNWYSSPIVLNSIPPQFAPDEKHVVMVFVSKEKYDSYFEEKPLEITVWNEYDTLYFNEKVSLYFTKSPYLNRTFDLFQDAYSFKNFSKLSFDDVLYISWNEGFDGMASLLYKALSTWNGRCFGMATTSGISFIDNDKKLYPTDLFTWDSSDVKLRDWITDYHLLQDYMEINNEIENNKNFDEKYNIIKEELKDGNPVIIGIEYQNLVSNGEYKTGKHAILATKLISLKNKEQSFVETYDSNYPKEITNLTYFQKDKDFDYPHADLSNNFIAIRLQEIPTDIVEAKNEFDDGVVWFLTHYTIGGLTLKNLYFAYIKLSNTSKINIAHNKKAANNGETYFYLVDDQGRRSGFLRDGTIINEIPEAFIERLPASDKGTDSLSFIYVPDSLKCKMYIFSNSEGNLHLEYLRPLSEKYAMYTIADSITVSENSVAIFDNSNPGQVLLDYDGDGNVDQNHQTNQTLVGIKELRNKTQIPEQYNIYQNYPNPFNQSTKIKYDIPKTTFTILCIYDLLGRKIRTLINKTLVPGTYSVVWDGKDDQGKNVASGIYLYQLKTKNFVKTRKLILMK